MEEELGISKVTRNFQITLPEKVRKELKIKEGEYVGFIKNKKSGEIVIRPAKIIYKKT